MYIRETVSDYFYQKVPSTDPWIGGKWACGGIVTEHSKNFYREWFATHDTRGRDFDTPGRREVKIVRGYRGNVTDVLE